jgi:hypothetical protein
MTIFIACLILIYIPIILPLFLIAIDYFIPYIKKMNLAAQTFLIPLVISIPIWVVAGIIVYKKDELFYKNEGLTFVKFLTYSDFIVFMLASFLVVLCACGIICISGVLRYC